MILFDIELKLLSLEFCYPELLIPIVWEGGLGLNITICFDRDNQHDNKKIPEQVKSDYLILLIVNTF